MPVRRAPIVAGATILGLVGVLTFHTHAPSSGSSLAALTQPSSSPSSTTTTSAPPPATAPPGPSSTPPASSSPPTTAAPPTNRQAVGKLVPYGYGELAVKVTVSGTKITSVAVQNLQTAEQYSQQLADQVIPMLRSEVLSAQSANINGVSGATYTSEAYAQSLQSALNQLHLP